MSGGPTVLQIASASAIQAGLAVKTVLGASQTTPVTMARERAFYLARQMRPDLSLVMIGRPFGRDHSAVHLGALRVARRLAERDDAEAATLAKIRGHLADAPAPGEPLAILALIDEELAIASAALDRARALREHLVGGWA